MSVRIGFDSINITFLLSKEEKYCLDFFQLDVNRTIKWSGIVA